MQQCNLLIQMKHEGKNDWFTAGVFENNKNGYDPAASTFDLVGLLCWTLQPNSKRVNLQEEGSPHLPRLSLAHRLTFFLPHVTMSFSLFLIAANTK